MDAPPEVMLAAADELHLWHARSPGLSRWRAHVGRLLVTSRRVLFLSTGGSGIARELAFTALGGSLLGLTAGRTRTDELDLSALDRPGSVELPLERVISARLARRWDLSNFLLVEATNSDGSRASHAFMTRFGGGRALLAGVQRAIERARQERLANPYRV